MRITIHTYGEIRELHGRKELEAEVPADATIRDVLVDLTGEFDDLDLVYSFQEESLLIVKNGTHITFLDGLETTLEDGDQLGLSWSPMPE